MKKFFMVENRVIDDTTLFKTSSQHHIYMVLCRFCNNHKAGFPSLKRLCRITKRSKKTVVESIDYLEKMGFITLYKQRGKANIYTIRPLEDENLIEHIDILGNYEKKLENLSKHGKFELDLEDEDYDDKDDGLYKDDEEEEEDYNGEYSEEREKISKLLQNVIAFSTKNPIQTVEKQFPPNWLNIETLYKVRDAILESDFLSGKLKEKPDLETFLDEDSLFGIIMGFYRSDRFENSH